MENKSLIKIAILGVCWHELFRHSLTWSHHDQIWLSEKERAVSVLQSGPSYVEVTQREANEMLDTWISEYLDKRPNIDAYGYVILYTSSDNGLISLDDPKDFTEDLDTLTDPPYPELNGKLYLAYD